MNKVNYYEILEITENASQEVIKAAYRALAKKYHPDSYSGAKSEREKNMEIINEAYAVLSDEQKRKKYDLKFKPQSSNKSNSQREKTSESRQQNTCNEEEKSSNTYQNNQSVYSDSQGKLNESLKQNEYYSHNRNNEYNEESKVGGLFGRIVRGVGEEIVKSVQNNNRETENAYLDGISMDNYTLIRKFKQAKGYKRAGYAKALEEKDLLERNYDGKLVPTYKYKCML